MPLIKEEEKPKKLDFSKIMIIVVFVCCIIWITDSFVLAHLGKEVNDTVTVTIVTALLGSLVTYFVSQVRLKESRNKYCVNEDGIPFKYLEEDEEN